MNHQKNLIKIVLFSFCLSLFGFFIDSDQRVLDIGVNIFEIIMMTSIIFLILTIIYVVVQGVILLFKNWSVK